uniref:Uncharacterized protein n=1 Tax=viral metagenome TaxID=1070528 RepID=A0A6C0C4L4_9ZZZZ
MEELNTGNIFRYKFDSSIVSLIDSFSTTHKYDDTCQFRDEWDEFIKENKSEIEREKHRLIVLGYTGNIHSKMYKSARYYYKNKSTEKKKTKPRRKYVTLNKGFLIDMDRHIINVAFNQDLKPAHAYNNFVSDPSYSGKYDDAIQKLLEESRDEHAAETKLKKTYKNRYFIKQKSSIAN